MNETEKLMDATRRADTLVQYEIGSYRREIRSLRAEKSHLRRWINEAKRHLQPYSWELADRAADRIASNQRQIDYNEEKYAKLDETIGRWKAEIAKLEAKLSGL
jgi:chromosome segregation ATPase